MALPVRVEQHGHLPDPLEMIRQDFGNVLGRFFGGGGLFGNEPAASPFSGLATYGVDIREDADHIYVEADLPGFRPEDVDVSLEDGTLTIVAERKDETDEPAGRPQQGQAAQAGQTGQPGQQQQPAQGGTERQSRQGGQQQQQQQQSRDGGNYLLRERRYTRFVRSFTLPPNVDEQNVQAKLENGVLRITLNKREDAKPRRIQVA
jgi:HSP20 family protein